MKPNPESTILKTCSSLSSKLYGTHDALACIRFLLSEYFEKNGELTLQEQNGFTEIFEGVLEKLDSCKANVDLICNYIKAVKARELEGANE